MKAPEPSGLSKVQRQIREDLGLPAQETPLPAPLGETIGDGTGSGNLPWQVELPEDLRERVNKKFPGAV